MTENKDIKKEERIKVLDSMPIKKAIWILAIPTMTANLIQTIYNMTDTFFIGRLNDPNMVSAITICMPIVMFIQTFGSVFGIGGASLISRLLGQKELKKANHATSISFWSAMVVSIIATGFALLLMEPILKMIGTSENTLIYAKKYLFFMLLGGPFICLQISMSGLLRSEGATKNAMIGMVSGSLINILLDPIFIFLLKMNLEGAAIATTIGNIFGFSYNLIFYLRKKSILSISIKDFVFEKIYFSDILKIGIPASLGMMLMSIGLTISNIYGLTFGDNVIAANGIVMRVTNISIMMIMGMGHGCQPLLGYSYGSKRFDRLFETIKRSVTANTIISVVSAIIFYTFSREWIQVFINNQEVIDLGVTIMKVMVYSMPFMGVQIILMTTFQSLGKTIQSLVITLGRQGLFFIPAIMIFSSLWGFKGYIIAQPFANIVTTILALVLFFAMRKKLLRELEDARQENQEEKNAEFPSNTTTGIIPLE